MSIIQAVLFNRKFYKNQDVIKEFLTHHKNITPIKKPHVTKNYYRLRISQPDYKNYRYVTKNLRDDGSIKFIIGYPK